MEVEKRLVFNIQRFSINDGPGIRTTVFLKGCMLNCVWCHNPESKQDKPQLMFTQQKCIGCGECVRVCPEGVHHFDESGNHVIDRSICRACGCCEKVCVGALEVSGKGMTTQEIMDQVTKDKDFYCVSGGGMTISGGEPLLHPAFTQELLKAAKEEGIHTCLETCGFAKWEQIEALLPYVDIFLWDVKEKERERHLEYTGVPNELILENLHRLNKAGAKIILRCPIIPGFNARADHLQFIADLANSLENVLEVHVEPYHPLGKSKSQSLGEKYLLEDISFPAEDCVRSWIDTIASSTSKPIRKA